ncbi:MAG: MCP four helix bundle domain-containing protein, partial [Syntrophales bacterium LBB04]|nr:MCP four helix bundle domain-containing protein [Syntrophales bacterium LBB04]
MFKNMKLATKVLSGFVLIALVAGLIGMVGIVKIKQIDDADTMLYEKVAAPLEVLADISIAFQRIRVNIRDLMDATGREERTNIEKTITELKKQISEKSITFEKTILTDEGRKAFDEFKHARQVYEGYLEKAVTLNNQDKVVEAQAIVKSDGKAAAQNEQSLLEKLMDLKTKQGAKL